MLDINIKDVCFQPTLCLSESEKNVYEDVVGALMQNSLIEYCNVLLCGKKALVGVVPYPLYSRSQREKLQKDIKEKVYSLYDFEEVVVSFDTDIIYSISKYCQDEIKEEEFLKLFNMAKNRR